MKTILRFFYTAAFVLTFVVGVAAVAGGRFRLSFLLPAKTETTEQIVAAPIYDSFPPEPSLVESQPAIFDADGSYYLAEESTPNAFKDIRWLEITTHEFTQENGFAVNPIVPTGGVFTGRGFEFRSITISDREITFETREVQGVVYRFVGHFPKYPEFEYCEGCEIPPDLKGKLTKLKNGKVIAETNAEFYVAGC